MRGEELRCNTINNCVENIPSIPAQQYTGLLGDVHASHASPASAASPVSPASPASAASPASPAFPASFPAACCLWFESPLSSFTDHHSLSTPA